MRLRRVLLLCKHMSTVIGFPVAVFFVFQHSLAHELHQKTQEVLGHL
ncbi:MAG TPA: hypothetical protein VJU84_05640 [Pyrinomonadaceae bacterium]|nr:hypothetical protein [Pyrinomonadaceae bacterium]